MIIGEGIDLSSLFTTTHQHSIYITEDTTPDAADPMPIDLTFHHSTSLTLEKDLQILRVLRVAMHSKLKVTHVFSKIEPYPQTCCQFHASCLTVSWKLPQHKTEVMTRWSQHNHVISKDDRGQPETIEPNSVHLWLNLETLSIKL